MQKLLLGIFIYLSSMAMAQRDSLLRPFEDYTNCTTGFATLKGDTIWPAQFERVTKPIKNNWEPVDSWIVVFEGKFGVLSKTGSIVLPFEYSDIQMLYHTEVFTATKKGKTGLFDKNGKVIYPMEIDSIEVNDQFHILFYQNGKMGMISGDQEVIIKPEYDYIEDLDYSIELDPTNGTKKSYYVLRKDNLYGLADNQGKVYFTDACCPFIFNYSPVVYNEFFLSIHREQSGYGLMTLNKEVLIEPENKDFNLYTLINGKGDSLVYAHVIKTDEIEKAYLIDQRKVSNNYVKIIPGTHAILFEGKRKKGYLNADFKETYVSTIYDLRFGAHPEYFREEMDTYSPDLPFDPNSDETCVLVLAYSKKSKKSRYSTDRSYGLINVKTGAKVNPQFQTIIPKMVDDKLFLFAFNKFDEETERTTFSIFNSQLEIIDTFTLQLNHIYNFKDFFYRQHPHPGFVFKGANGKMGAIRADGSLAVPFIYDELRPQYSNFHDKINSSRIAAKNENKNGTIDWNGNVLIPIEYDYVQPFPNNLQIAAKPGGYVLYDSLYRPLISGCQIITTADPKGLRGYRFTNDRYLQEHAFYAVKNDTAFAFFQDGFRVLNENNLTTNITKRTIAANKLLVESSGKCLFYGEKVMMGSPEVYYAQVGSSLCFYHVKKGKTVCSERSTASVNQDDYIHVYQRPDKEGLISKETGEWILEPNDYFKILTEGKVDNNSTNDHFWYVLKDNSTLTASMWTYERVGKGKLDRKFDVPIFEKAGNYFIARSNGKFGLLDTAHHDELPFEYKNIIYSNKQFFVKGFDNIWSAWTPENGLIPLHCTDISLNTFTNGRIIYSGDRFAVLSPSNEILVPFRSINYPPDTLSLYKLLGELNYDREYYYWREAIHNEEDEIGRRYNNSTILDLSLVYSTRHQVTEAKFLRNKTESLRPVLVDPVYSQEYESRRIHFKSKRFITYTENSGSRKLVEYLKYNVYTPFSANGNSQIYHSLMLDGKNLRPVTLNDIFKENVNYNALLDQKLTDVINKKQIFGLQCMNLPQILEEYKRNFHLEKSGISFSMENNSRAIIIPWAELKGLIKEL